ncbi:acyl-CoA reductase [Celerinatantimonas sp. YJH-8]|uniref:acyl-CoA reductase n=1 Tax=Celerinatantimonas sp. YJH-8 TaxID=3228714 RepID=UPI0038C7DD10
MQRYLQLEIDEDAIERVCPAQPLSEMVITPLRCFDPLILNFIEAFCERIGHLPDAPNAKALAFFLRARALQSAIAEREQQGPRSPLGLSFHLVPSNVPMSAFYSALASLLQGNPTLVRLSSTLLPEQEAVLAVLAQLLSEPRWQAISERVRFIRYPHSDTITRAISAQAASRVIWGGDASIAQIRQYPLSAGARELSFANRQSLALLDEQSIRQLPGRSLELQLSQLATDISLFDQQSCSSPALLVWVGSDDSLRERVFRQLAEAYPDEHKQHSAQQAHLQLAAADGRIDHYQWIDALGWGHLRASADELIVPEHRGGTLYWLQTPDLNWLAQPANFQTCVAVGISRELLREKLLEHPEFRLDRIVAPGQALAFDWHWDGWDLLSALSRSQG